MRLIPSHPNLRAFHRVAVAVLLLVACRDVTAPDGRTVRGKSATRDASDRSGSWEAKAPMPVYGGGATAVIGGKIYVAMMARLDVYDPATNTWSSPSPDYESRLDVYDPATDSWTTRTPSPVIRGADAAAEIGGKYYLVGG